MEARHAIVQSDTVDLDVKKISIQYCKIPESWSINIKHDNFTKKLYLSEKLKKRYEFTRDHRIRVSCNYKLYNNWIF